MTTKILSRDEVAHIRRMDLCEDDAADEPLYRVIDSHEALRSRVEELEARELQLRQALADTSNSSADLIVQVEAKVGDAVRAATIPFRDAIREHIARALRGTP